MSAYGGDRANSLGAPAQKEYNTNISPKNAAAFTDAVLGDNPEHACYKRSSVAIAVA
jgi:hypothetical protein